jgi:hypothetical protein
MASLQKLNNYKKYKITLLDEDQEIVLNVAKKRTEHAQKNGYYNNWGTVDPYKIDLEGFGAEMAFCRLFNCEPDTTDGLKNDDYDTITKKGNKVDIKWTANINNGLLVKASKEKKMVDVYVLVVGNFPTYEIIGYALKDDVFKEDNLKPSKYGHMNHCISVDKLKKF